ncbi:MAG TPA: ABC transporter permease [Gammaproteobacteria bacterium]|nr:ABC transporter permease [Gammaproteobacteria bacterium]
MNGFLHDVRFGLRQLAAKPGFAAAAIVTLALGIGANTAVFSVLNGYLLKPLPYPQSQQLIAINESFPNAHQPYVGVSAMNYLDIKKDATVLADAALYKETAFNLTINGQTELVPAVRARADLFDVLRVKPYLGQVFGDLNDQGGRDHVAVLSYGLWQTVFGGNRDAIGRTIKLYGEPYRVIAVMPRHFAFPDSSVGLWVPFHFPPQLLHKCRTCEHNQQLIARLKPGADLNAARAQLHQITSRIVAAEPAWFNRMVQKTGWHLRARSYRGKLLGDRATLLFILQGFVLLLLLMTCVNVANLLLARILGRTHEIAMRAALGASLMRLVRQVFVEAFCLTIPGGLAGVALGWLGLSFIQNIGFGARLGLFTLTPDWRVGLFALIVVVLVAVIISALPIRQLSRRDLQGLLQEGGRSIRGGRGARRIRGALVVAEIALAAALLGGTGLLVNSFLRLQSADPGFDAARVLTAEIVNANARDQYYDELLRRVRALPGVESAGVVNAVPIEWPPLGNAYTVPGESPMGPHKPLGNMVIASEGYFGTLGIPLLRGRVFAPGDSRPMVVVDKKLADQWFPDSSPIGHQITLGGDPTRYTIIGEVGTVYATSLDSPPQRGTYYLNAAQNAFGDMHLVVKTSMPPYRLVKPLKQVVRDLSPNASISHFISMADVLAQSLTEREALMMLVLVFACIGLALAAVGVYGVLNYVVNQRVTECGVRLALGALPADLLWLIIRDGLRMLAIGLCIGLGLAVVLGYAISSQLFNVAPFDPLTLAGVVVALSIITIAACYLPARRASKLDPSVAMLEQ